MKKLLFTSILLCFLLSSLHSQMWNGTDTLYGNEWINYEQSYFKIPVSEDGIYRIPKSDLEAAGIPIGGVLGEQFQVFYLGQEVPLYVSTDGAFGAGDYIEFYGQKNRSELDRFLYVDPDNEMLNPGYSLFTDTSAYFLTWTDSGEANRFDQVNNDLSNLPAKETYFLYDEKVNYNSSHVKEKFTNGIYYSNYTIGEGFANPLSQSLEVPLAPKHISTALGESKVSVRLMSESGQHNLVLSFNGTQQLTDAYSGYTLKNFEFEVPTSSLTGDDKVLIKANADDNDYHAVSSVVLSYPHTFNFDGQDVFRFTIKASNTPLYLEIENFNVGGNNPVLYDVTNNIRMTATNDNSLVKIKLPPSSTPRQLVLINQNSGYASAELQEVNFVNYDEQEGQFIIISNPLLYNDGSGTNWVAEYADYRRSASGGSYASTVVDIQQLYDQFAYGIQRHSISIRNFGHYIVKEWQDPQYVFLIGKAREYNRVRTDDQLALASNESFYLPTFGFPGSDNLLLAGPGTNVPILPIARIAAADAGTIKNYLDKVQLMESTVNNPQTVEDRLWMKRILHLGGGGPNEQTTIKNHLINMERLIESNKFGAEVTSFYKNSSDPIQIGESDEIFETINNGVSIITFFGHSAVGTFDFNIDNPNRYENYGKYPLLLSLGCYSGNIHTNSEGISERFIFLKDKGALAFGASTGQGFISSLRTFAERYYALLGSDYYGEGIGKILQETIRTYENQNNLGMVTLMQQFTLHGDPALRLNPSPGPDYTTDASSVSFEPEIITAQMDSFTMNFSVLNLGFNQEDSIVIEIAQQLPDGDKITLVRKKVPTPPFEANQSYRLASFGKVAAGLNRFYVTIDVENDVDELPGPAAESNNELLSSNGVPGIPLFIFDDSAQPVYPQKFGIVNDENITLKASTSNALAPEGKYILEIDTTALFNSPLKARKEIIQGGGILKWEPGITMQDSMVYYWRVSPDSISPQASYVWENSSFVYLQNSSNGWNQSHYYQYKSDEFYGLRVNQGENFEFDVNGVVVRLVNKIWDPSDRPQFIWDFGNPAVSVRPWPYFDNGISVFVGDSISGFGWINPPNGDYGSINPNNNTRCFSFPTNTTEGRENLINFLENVVQPNNYVILFTVASTLSSDFAPETWAQDSVSLGKNIFSILEEQGATRIRELEQAGTVPYTFIYKKDAFVLAEDIAVSIDQRTDTEVYLPLNAVSGQMSSKLIGPSSEWESLSWKTTNFDSPADSTYVKVYGINTSGLEETLIEKLEEPEISLSEINAEQYPFLRLELFAEDELERTAVDLDYWRVHYHGLPDAAINANEYYTFKNDTLQQGDQMQIEMAIENISDYDMDSLLIKLTVTDETNNEIINYKRVGALETESLLTAGFELTTEYLSGLQNMTFQVNPDDDQPESYHFNNIAVKQFFVERDMKNPILDVTFDGIHIMNGDIISPKPNIYISLKDENPYLELSDTSLFKVFLKYPGANVAENISFDNDWIKFFPATLNGPNDKNNAYIEFTPVFEEDGIYQLLVQAEDATGNQSGELDYKVNFEVIRKQSISNVLNYPNPFSTSTQFVYTLTGEEIPEYFKIQIMTVSGKIVKEITEAEIGPLKIGTHRTDYRWDGTDTYGSRLANGVYLYRVVAKKSTGEEYEAFDTGTDQFFKQGFGKLVILR